MPRLAKGVFASLVVALLFGTSARAQTFTYTTDWLGNTFSGANGSHVPNGIDAIAVTPSGTTYANCWYDENAGEVSEFNTSSTWVNFTAYLHGFSRNGGYAVAVNSTYVYVGMVQAESGDNPIESGSSKGDPLVNGNNLAEYPVNNTGSPNYTAITGNYWDCVRRYTLAGGVSAVPTYGYSSDDSMVIVSTTENDSQIGTSSNPDGASIGTSGPVLGIAANNSYVFVSDNTNNKVHVYNASTMAPVATWTIPGPPTSREDNTSIGTTRMAMAACRRVSSSQAAAALTTPLASASAASGLTITPTSGAPFG